MTTHYFENSTRKVVESFFSFPLDYIVNLPTRLVDYREVLAGASASRYVKAMLSPRWVLTDGKCNVYSTTVDQLPDKTIREQLLRGVGLAHRTMGDEFTYQVFKLFGSLIGSFLMAETFYQIDVGFYQKNFLPDKTKSADSPYDFKPFYLAVFIGQLEMHYPANFSMPMAPELCRRLDLDMIEVVALTQRVLKLTGRPPMDFTFH